MLYYLCLPLVRRKERMNELCERYVRNITRVQALTKPPLTRDMPQEEVLRAIHENAIQQHDLRVENDEILNELIFAQDPAELTDEQIGDLSALADALFNYTSSLDVGIAYRIHQLLYACATRRGDRNMIIRELYYQGLTLQYLNLKDSNNDLNLYYAQIGDYYTRGAAYMSEYEQIEDQETRGYIIRCMGNRKFGLRFLHGQNVELHPREVLRDYESYDRCFRETLAIVDNPRYRAMNPDLPWERYAYALHMDRTSYLTMLRAYQDDRIAQAVYESAQFVYEYRAKSRYAKNSYNLETFQYIYPAALYHAGKISIQELIRELFALCQQVHPNDYSSAGIMFNLHVPLYLQSYAKRLPPEEKAILMPRIQELLDRGRHYIGEADTGNASMMQTRAEVKEIIRMNVTDNEFFNDHMLSYILASHAPTYIHSLMTAHLTALLARRMVETNPAFFVGVMDTASPEEVAARSEEIIRHAYRCGLYHDLGKSQILREVGIYGRRLLDEEFHCIQYHPTLGSALLSKNAAMQDEAAVALRHHLFYNQHGGYLDPHAACPEPVRRLVDIVTVCDSLDAATDNVGRSYANAKTFTMLVNELRFGAGVRYSPDVVRLFDDEAFRGEVETSLRRERRAIYCRIYTEENEA